MDLLADFLHFGTSVFLLLDVGLEQCEVWGVKSAVWSVKCEGSSGKWEVWSVECEVWSVECEVSVWSAKSAVWSVKCEVWSVKEAVRSEKWSVDCECELWSVKCEVWSVKFEVWSAKSAVWSVECGVWRLCFVSRWKNQSGLSREGHGRDRLSLNYRSFMFGKLPPPACPGLCYTGGFSKIQYFLTNMSRKPKAMQRRFNLSFFWDWI